MQSTLTKAIERRLPEAVELLQDLIRFQSTPGNEGPVVDFLARYLGEAGFSPERCSIAEDIVNDPEYTPVPGHRGYQDRSNLLARVGEGAGRSVILNTHCDVVPGKPELFEPRVEGDVVFGRGACDAKGQIAVAVLALLALRDAGVKFAGEVLLQIVIEEESGGNGSLAMIRQGHRADAVIVLEPTVLHTHPANRGAVWFKLEVRGKPIHMGKYYEGVNAVEEMMDLLEILRRYRERLREDSRGHPLFPDDPSPVTVNIGTIQGGEWPSMVPAECVVEGGISFLPNKRLAQVRDEVRQAVEAEAGEWAKANCRLTFDRLHNDSYETPMDDPVVEAFCAAADAVRGQEPPTGFPASSDARLFFHTGSMPTITFGPGDLGHAHAEDEQISISQIAQGAEILARFLMNWAGR